MMKRADDENIFLIELIRDTFKHELEIGKKVVATKAVVDTLDSAIKAMEKGEKK
jgi:hypothetical protein